MIIQKKEVSIESTKSKIVSNSPSDLKKKEYTNTDLTGTRTLKREEDPKEKEKKSLIRRFLIKETFDRIGYGFGSTQYINILFYQTIFLNPFLSHSIFFIIAAVNGLKVILSVILSSLIREYGKNHSVSKKFIGISGIIFGFSFMFLAIGRFLANYPGYSNLAVPVYILAFLVGSVGVVSYGESYQKMFRTILKKEKRGPLLGKVVRYGLLLTVVCLLLGAWIMDRVDSDLNASYFREENRDLYIDSLNEKQVYPLEVTGGSLWQPKIPFTTELSSFRVFGYLLVFWIATLALIISGYVLSFFKDEKKVFLTKIKFSTQLRLFMKRVEEQSAIFFKNKTILVILIASSITGLIQILAGTFYGIFIWLNFGNFLNVALIFALALLASLVSDYVARSIPKIYGNVPVMVFGTVLLAIGPLSYYYSYQIMQTDAEIAILIAGVGTMIWVMGSAVVGLAKGRLIQELIPEKYRESYFTTFSLLILIPYLILIPLGGYLADSFGLHNLFFSLGALLIIFVAPLYLLLLSTNKNKI